MLNSITGQEKPLARLHAMFLKNTVPHAMLFSGIEGVGKADVATYLAMAFNCRNMNLSNNTSEEPSSQLIKISCKKCTPCKKILSRNHPDFIEINPTGKIIKISQIRDLCSTLLLKSYEADKRVVIINKAETMNKEAGNALLKVLEEPPANTFFILTSTQPSDLLPTILSRCQNIGFYPVSSENIKLYLNKYYKITKETAEVISAVSNGNLKNAVLMADNNKYLEQSLAKRLWVIDEFNTLKNQPLGKCLLFAEKLTEKKEDITNTLGTLLNYVRDLIVHKYNNNEIINHDLAEKISQQSKIFSVESLLTITNLIQDAQKEIMANASLRLTLESMVIKIARV